MSKEDRQALLDDGLLGLCVLAMLWPIVLAGKLWAALTGRDY